MSESAVLKVESRGRKCIVLSQRVEENHAGLSYDEMGRLISDIWVEKLARCEDEEIYGDGRGAEVEDIGLGVWKA